MLIVFGVIHKRIVSLLSEKDPLPLKGQKVGKVEKVEKVGKVIDFSKE